MLMPSAPTSVDLVRAEIGERLRQERARLGYNQASFAAAVGVSKTTQFNYEQGERAPDSIYLHAADRLGVDTHYVVTGKRIAESEGDFLSVPMLALPANHDVSGTHEPEVAYRINGMSVPRSWVRERSLNALSLAVVPVRGHSMERVLSDGDLCLVDTNEGAPQSGFLYALRQADELLVRYCQLLPGGILRVTSESPQSPPYDVDLSNAKDFSIIGRVVFSTHEW